MIAGCPKCGARYRVDAGKLRPEGARLRCTQCQAVFRVASPRPAGMASPPSGSKLEPAAPQPGLSRHEERRAQAAPAGTSASGAAVLIADPDVASGKATASSLAEWGFQPLLVHDGVEAVLAIQRSLPKVVVLDAALPKMFGFQVCELIKRNEQLRSIHVVLVGAIHAEERYRRAPSELYGADAYIERPQLPEGLRRLLGGLAIGAEDSQAGALAAAEMPPSATPVASAPVREAPALASAEPVPVAADPTPAMPAPIAADPTPAPIAADPTPAMPAPIAAKPAADAARSAAERLARIVVSDIVLYNPEKFEAGVRDGNVVEVLSAELDEGRALFEMRVNPKVREGRDFLAEELIRVARMRGMS